MISESPAERTPWGSKEKVAERTQAEVETGSSSSGLERTLSSRHLQFIAVGATIGTGLFIGLGSALAKAGPVSLLLAFIFMGSVVYSVMASLGEMASFIPVTGSFTVYATRFVDPTLGFSMGWLYWFNWSITFAVELVAAGLIIQYWNDQISVGVWIAVFWFVFTALNFLPVRIFGEIEMWFSMIKVVTLVGFLIFSICINAGVGQGGYIGFKFWDTPGPFANYMVDGPVGKFVGFWAVLVTAGFSYQGTELVGVGAGETANPQKAIPEAIRWTFWGIFGLFISTVFFVGINLPYNAEGLGSGKTDASASPLVLVAMRAGVPVLPHILNGVLLTAVLTAANSNVYSSSRLMVALAQEGLAPKFMKNTNRYGTPYYAVGLCSVLGLVAFINLSSNGTVVFNWLVNISATSSFITWALVSVCHLRFRKVLRVQGVSLQELPYLAPLFPFLTWWGLFFNSLITITNGFTCFIEWSTSEFFSAYISLIFFVVLYVGHKIVCRTKVVPLAEVDLSRGHN
ncbi:amino acid permease [Colletotrichum truncatum]|uniref:Amino acid permease n=1 Tax=Colletotrichum truncatum TaxID=5467 RepID=A0ACC3Z5A8_COLTU|nr:amino acid permease [Colletotrichum truncatum]KAF6795111.1 amino acid permease [Colletotrichum truncatum]